MWPAPARTSSHSQPRKLRPSAAIRWKARRCASIARKFSPRSDCRRAMPVPRRRRGRLEGFRLTMAVAVTVTAAGAWSGTASASPAQDYMLYCMGCHGPQAQGVPGKVPPLAHSIGRFMRSAAGRDYLLRVPGAANSVVAGAQLAAVLNWLAAEFNSDELTADMPKF